MTAPAARNARAGQLLPGRLPGSHEPELLTVVHQVTKLKPTKTAAELLFWWLAGSPNGVRTRVSTLRGWCPRPLDDGAEREQSSRKARRPRAAVSGPARTTAG